MEHYITTTVFVGTHGSRYIYGTLFSSNLRIVMLHFHFFTDVDILFSTSQKNLLPLVNHALTGFWTRGHPHMTSFLWKEKKTEKKKHPQTPICLYVLFPRIFCLELFKHTLLVVKVIVWSFFIFVFFRTLNLIFTSLIRLDDTKGSAKITWN